MTGEDKRAFQKLLYISDDKQKVKVNLDCGVVVEQGSVREFKLQVRK